MWQANTISKKLKDCLKLLNIHPGLYILIQKAIYLNTFCAVRKFWQNNEK